MPRTPEEIAREIEEKARWDTKDSRLDFRMKVSADLVRAGIEEGKKQGMAEAYRDASRFCENTQRWRDMMDFLERKAEEVGG